jgi:5-methyltetrahydropteroyltriglutamate--homocysteine methyltransferase
MGTPGLLPTTLVGSYPQPDWLIDRERLGERLPPRVRAQEMWRVPEPRLEQAQDDATLLALRDFELAGIDIVTDGEIRLARRRVLTAAPPPRLRLRRR